MEEMKKNIKMKKQTFIQASPYGVAKLYAHWITINYKEVIIYLLVMVFYLIMKVQEEEKHLLQKNCSSTL